jgi:hypothetical protein
MALLPNILAAPTDKEYKSLLAEDITKSIIVSALDPDLV